MVNITDLLHKQKTIELEMKKYKRLKEQRFELLQLRKELMMNPDEEDMRFLESLNESISNMEARMKSIKRNLKRR
jgi:hypothetical protein